MNTETIGAFDLLSRMRFACGDNGKRMQDELEEYLRELKRDAERYRHLFACPEPFCYRGEVYDTKIEADAAIDVAMNGANA